MSITQSECYSGGYSPLILDQFKQRTFTKHGAFLRPYLTVGQTVLDCGCGPGSLTLDIAEIVAPGFVTGIDSSNIQIGQALQLQKQRAIFNAGFGVGSAYRLPYADEEFDVVFAHAVLYHLRWPERALAEFRRVLKPRGLVALRDACHSGDMMLPMSPDLSLAWEVIAQVFEYQGGNVYFGQEYKGLLLARGFREIVLSFSYDTFATNAEKEGIRAYWTQFLTVDHRQLILDRQWLTANGLARLASSLDEWNDNPLSFFARARCEAVARK